MNSATISLAAAGAILVAVVNFATCVVGEPLEVTVPDPLGVVHVYVDTFPVGAPYTLICPAVGGVVDAGRSNHEVNDATVGPRNPH